MQTGNGGIEIREANENDVDAVLEYLSGLLAECPPYLILPPTLPSRAEELSWMHKYMQPSESTLLLAFSGPRVIGLLEFDGRTRPSPRGPGNMGMSVAVDERSKGIGRALLSRFLAWAEEKGLTSRTDLHVYADNLPALALYRRMGFAEVSRRVAPDSTAAGEENEIIRMSSVEKWVGGKTRA